jgi:DAK2 domain fusion protein YloV
MQPGECATGAKPIPDMVVTTLDGPAFRTFVLAGTYFLRKYRGVLNDLNVFPVPDGDTGSNMYLTARAASLAIGHVHDAPLSAVAAAAAQGSLLGARGNSGVILSQMLRGFAHAVRHREAIDTFGLALAMKDAVAAARAALAKPVEGTILSVAQRAADEAYLLAMREPDLARLAAAMVRAANDALERTPDQLPALREAGVVDAGGAGFLYFLEGVLRFLPEATARATAFPRRPVRSRVFSRQQSIGEGRFCTEFVLEDTTAAVPSLRDELARLGDSLIVAGAAPTIKVHLHTAVPGDVQALAATHGTVTRLKIENMAKQHQLLVVDPPSAPFAVATVVPGAGFDRIARELGADVVIPAFRGANPSVEELLVGVNATLCEQVVLLPNDPNVALAAREVAALTAKRLTIVPTGDVLHGLAVQLALAGRDAVPDAAELAAAAGPLRTAAIFFAGRATSVEGVAVAKGAPCAKVEGALRTAASLDSLIAEVAADLGADAGGLITLYYGGRQKERDAQRLAAELGERFAQAHVEYYFGGAPEIEYWMSVE